MSLLNEKPCGDLKGHDYQMWKPCGGFQKTILPWTIDVKGHTGSQCALFLCVSVVCIVGLGLSTLLMVLDKILNIKCQSFIKQL